MKKIRFKNSFVVVAVLALSAFPLTAHAESEHGDMTQGYQGGNVHVNAGEGVKSFQTQAEADTYANNTIQASVQREAATATAAGKPFEVTVVNMSGQDTTYVNEIAEQQYRPDEAAEAAEMQRNLAKHRASMEGAKKSLHEFVENGKGREKGLPGDVDKSKVVEAQKADEEGLKKFDQQIDTLVSGYESQVKAEKAKKDADRAAATPKGPRVLISVENNSAEKPK